MTCSACNQPATALCTEKGTCWVCTFPRPNIERTVREAREWVLAYREAKA